MNNFKKWLETKEVNELAQTAGQIFNSALATVPPGARVTDIIKTVIQKNPAYQTELQALAADYMKAQTQKTGMNTNVTPTTTATQTVTPAATGIYR